MDVKLFSFQSVLKTWVCLSEASENLMGADNPLVLLIIVLAWIVDVYAQYHLYYSVEVVGLPQGILRH